MDDAPRLGGAQRTPSLLRCGLKHRAVVGKMLEGDAGYVHSAVSPDIETNYVGAAQNWRRCSNLADSAAIANSSVLKLRRRCASLKLA